MADKHEPDKKAREWAKDSGWSRAWVFGCRSWDHGIYFTVSNDIRGWIYTDDPYIFAIAAAAQAAHFQVFIKYTGYDPNGNGGTGSFASVQLALQE